MKSLLFTDKEESWSGGLRRACAAETKRKAFRRGAVDETRTRDLNLGKVALYQLSYYRVKKPLSEVVRTKRFELLRPEAPDPKSGASAIPPRPRLLPQSGRW